MTQYKISQYLEKVGEYFGPLGWNDEDLEEYVIIPWMEFYRTMALSVSKPVLTDKRVIREKYKMMIDLGFAIDVNNKSAKYNVPKVRSYLDQCKEVAQ